MHRNSGARAPFASSPPPPPPQLPASVAASSASSAAPSTSFAAAFSSMTSSSLYTSVASMPPPVPAAPSSTSIAALVQAASVGNATTAASRAPFANNAARPPGAAAATAAGSASALAPPKPTSAHLILVSPRQKGNPLLSHLSHVGWEYGDKSLPCDYEVSDTICALYLSVKYHLLHGGYIQSRMHSIKGYTVRVLLVHVDVDDSERALLELTRLCFAFGWTMLCCWSPEEMARSDASDGGRYAWRNRGGKSRSRALVCNCSLLSPPLLWIA